MTEIESIVNITEETPVASLEISATIEEQNNINNKEYEAINELQSLEKTNNNIK